jgi:2-hydroxy-6-oxonona-2,4-dienedioate hydrolase/2-hydroxy-6-oxo-6-(2'-carboxyphenyl)-hexa-2,4-dienoate hydrolase
MKTLGEHFTVYAVDALFHGYTDKPEWDRPTDRHDMQVDAIADLMDALELPWAHIEGESMGGQLACEFGLRYPDRSGKIIMNTGVGRIRFKKTDFVVPEADYAELARLSAAAITDPTFDVVKKRLEWLMHDKARMTDDMAEIRLRIYQDPAINDALHRFNSVGLGKSDPWDLDPQWDEEVLSTFKPEALVFWTEHNPGEASDLGEYVAERIPGCLFYLMADAAHWPQWEKPEEHDAVVIQFLMG